jgi:hypothetical protein
MCKIVAKPEVPNAPITKYFRHVGSGARAFDWIRPLKARQNKEQGKRKRIAEPT